MRLLMAWLILAGVVVAADPATRASPILIPLIPLSKTATGMIQRAMQITGAKVIPETALPEEVLQKLVIHMNDYEQMRKGEKVPRQYRNDYYKTRFEFGKACLKYVDDPKWRLTRVSLLMGGVLGYRSYIESTLEGLNREPTDKRTPPRTHTDAEIEEMKIIYLKYAKVLQDELAGYTFPEIFEALGGFDRFGFSGTAGLIEEIRRLYDRMCKFPAERIWPTFLAEDSEYLKYTGIPRIPDEKDRAPFGDFFYSMPTEYRSPIRTSENCQNWANEIRWKGLRPLWTQSQNLSISARNDAAMLRTAQARLGDIPIIANLCRYHLMRHTNGAIGDERRTASAAASPEAVDHDADGGAAP